MKRSETTEIIENLLDDPEEIAAFEKQEQLDTEKE